MSFIDKLNFNHHPKSGAVDLLKYIGPGLLVTIGFIDPGNWASNLAAGSEFGYGLLWIVTFSSIILIIIQHNVAHLGIVTGLCLSEAVNKYIPHKIGYPILGTAMLASISTALAEILGGAIALQMLFSIPLKAGAVIVTIVCLAMLLSNTYSKIERWIITFVSIIGLSFLYELMLVDVDWGTAVQSWVKPSFPANSTLVIMSVLGAVVMPHNLFLHSEVIQSREWNLEDDTTIKKQLKFEVFDTIFSMTIGWAINSAMVILAASTFFKNHTVVTEIEQAQEMLVPLVGGNAGTIFAAALLLAGVSSTITCGIAGASIFAGFFGEAYHHKDLHSKIGILTSFIPALILIFFIDNPLKGLLVSQMLLSVQLPITIFTQVYLTSNSTVMGKYVNSTGMKILHFGLGIAITALKIALVIDLL